MKKKKRPPPIKKKSPDIDIWGMGSENLCNFLSPGQRYTFSLNLPNF